MKFNSRDELEEYARTHDMARLSVYLEDSSIKYPVDIHVEYISYTYGWDHNADLWKQALYEKTVYPHIFRGPDDNS